VREDGWWGRVGWAHMAVRGCFGVWVRGCSGAGGYRLCFLFLRCCFCFFEEENGEFVLVRAGRRDSVEVEESGWMDWSVFNWLRSLSKVIF
jgi:hypothetical protein